MLLSRPVYRFAGSVLIVLLALGGSWMLIHRHATAAKNQSSIQLSPPPSQVTSPTAGVKGAHHLHSSAEIQFVEQGLSSLNPSDQQEAIAILHQVAVERPKDLVHLPQLLKPLMEAKAYGEIAELTQAAILERPQDTQAVVIEQKARVQSLMALGQYGEALNEAKALYNVATLRATSNAIQLLADALPKARGEDGKAPREQFLTQQMAGALSATTSSANQSVVLDSIKLDEASYLQAIEKHRTSGKYNDLMACGNLYLLCGKPAEAKKSFVAACDVQKIKSSDKTFFAAVEGVARSIKAEQGSAGPADALILSMSLAAHTPIEEENFASDKWHGTDLQVAGQRIELAQLALQTTDRVFIDDELAATTEPVPDEAAQTPIVDEHGPRYGLNNALVVAALAPASDSQVTAWLQRWTNTGGRCQTTDLDKLSTIFESSTLPAPLFLQIAHAMQSDPASSKIAAMFYEAAADRVEGELDLTVDRPTEAAAIIRSLKDHMGGYKSALWPLIESGDKIALSALFSLYTSYQDYSRVASRDDRSLAKPYLHVRIGRCELLYLMGKPDAALAELENLKSASMDVGERRSFDWAFGLMLYELGRYSESIPHLSAVATTKGEFRDIAVSKVKRAEVFSIAQSSVSKEDAISRFTTFSHERQLGPLEARELELALLKAVNNRF